MALAPSTSLVFEEQRCKPELVAPAKPTPYEFKQLSDIDDQEGLRIQISTIHFYKHDSSILQEIRDPVKVIREALAQTLVFYYPFAGRLREGPGRKLVVECTGEGVMFIEANADITLEQFGDVLHPPFPCLDELLFYVPSSGAILHCPLLLIQVTCLKCGGFIFAVRLNHTMSDTNGLVQFMMAMGEMARGACTPSILPVWQRHLLQARDPTQVTCMHREYDDMASTIVVPIQLNDDMAYRTIFFGSTEVSTLRRFMPHHLKQCSTFELLTACLWRCRTIALQTNPQEEVRVLSVVNARDKFKPPLPNGYYGNACAFYVALTTAGKLCKNPLGYAVELLKKAKNNVTEEYLRSVIDLMIIKGRPHFCWVGSYLVSDVTRTKFGEVEFGWGKPFYGGPAKGEGGPLPGVSSFYIPSKNSKGENGILVPISLPVQAMERFENQLNILLVEGPTSHL
ncbi:hypothetical protein ACB098_12G086700 [Castanea mollissima]